MAHHVQKTASSENFGFPWAAPFPQTFNTVHGGKADINSDRVASSEIGGFSRLSIPITIQKPFRLFLVGYTTTWVIIRC